MRIEPFLGIDLVGAQDGPNVVVEDLSCGAGQRCEPCLLEPSEVGDQIFIEPLGAFGDFECREAMHMHVRYRVLHRLGDVDVVVAVEVRVDAALQGYFSGPQVPAFLGSLRNVIEGEEVRRAAQVER